MIVKGNTTKMVEFSTKTIILISLCAQNCMYALLRKYSTKYENISYKEILFISEVIKIVFAIYMILKSNDDKSDSEGQGISKLFWLVRNSKKMLILAMIYAAMNILSFIALEYIGAGEFTICAQLKILTTAGFSVLVLHTSLSLVKWRALILLVLGCILVASPSFNSTTTTSTATTTIDEKSPILGYVAVLSEVCLSGFASIYFEKVVKSTTEVITIWERNFQLSLYSLLMYGFIIIYETNDTNNHINNNLSSESTTTIIRNAWSNWSMITVLVSILGAAGGLLVAATLKYADSILKTLAAAGGIILTTILSHYFLDGPLNLVICIGGAVVIISIANYTFDNST